MDNWQERFDKRFPSVGNDSFRVIVPEMIGKQPSVPLLLHFIKEFIQSLLDQKEQEYYLVVGQALEKQKQEILEKIKLEEKTEGDGWEMLEHCCPGDDVANGYNQAVSDLEELKKTL